MEGKTMKGNASKERQRKGKNEGKDNKRFGGASTPAQRFSTLLLGGGGRAALREVFQLPLLWRFLETNSGL